MKCHNCGAELADVATVCCFCGCTQTETAAPTVPVVTETPVVNEAPVEPCEDSTPTRSKTKRLVGLIVTACITAVLSVVVILGLCTNWFGFYGPATRIALAAKNTYEQGNFTIVMSTREETNTSGSCTIISNNTNIMVDIDPAERELMLYGKSQQMISGETLTTYIGITDGYLINGSVWGNFHNFKKGTSVTN